MTAYPVFDADNHLYETREALTQFLPETHRRAIEYVEVGGRTKIAVRGAISDYIPNPTFDVVARPGAQEEYFRRGNPEGKSYREIMGDPMKSIPAFREPAPRVELLDELGIDRTILFPTLTSLVEERTRDDVELTHVVIHAFNQWLYETWSFNYEDRIFPTPVITLPIVDEAVRELEWCLERGARIVLVRPAAVPSIRGGSRSLGLPEFDPFWQTVSEAGIPIAFHASDSGYHRHVAEWQGGREWVAFRPDPLQRVVMGHRPITDTMAALVCHGVFTRFPELKVLSVENGGGYVAPLLDELAEAAKFMPQHFEEDPVAAFRRNAWVNPFHEDDVDAMVATMGVDHLLFGSDYPHPEGLADPVSYADRLTHLGEEPTAKIMGGNLSGLLGVPVNR